MGITLPVMLLLVTDLVFVLLGFGLLKLLSLYKHAAYAVMKRNFIGYFSNPTGYLFILLFVGLCSASAFFPHDFFNDNLATLHQLNLWFPWIMLVYIPTITMGIWSEERRQGTDELLLTVPADDWDIVLGKYLSAAAIFTVSLVFSQTANFMVMASLSLGDLDLGLFVTTYFGYWLIGLAMISLGMVGSFLTKNQTIGFILGVVLNLPLVISANADVFFSGEFAQRISQLSYAEQFFDFGRGVVSFRAIIFFAMVIAIGLYLSVVLVGRRHWLGGKDGESMLGHYIVRVIALVVLAFGLTFFFLNHDRIRFDGSSQQVSSLADDTKTLLGGIDSDQTILIEAFISRKIPEDYAKTKMDLISKLNEFKARAGNNVDVRIYDNLEPFSDEAIRAEEQYGIQPTTVLIRERGAMRQEDIYLGAAFTRGLEKVVVPFFDQGIPVEYELIRSISTVADTSRKRLGILTTGAQLMGGFDMQAMRQTPKQLIVEELEKQYEVVQIDPNNPIQDQIDVLLAVQPSSLNPVQMENFVGAVGRGIPTAIFEDPMPVMMGAVGTSQPNPPRGGMMGMGGQPGEPKGDMNQLWDLLGITMTGSNNPMGQFQADVIWQKYNPYNKTRGMRTITDEWVFATADAPGAEDALNPDNDTTSGLSQILMLYPGGIRDASDETVDFTTLIETGTDVGSIGYQQYMSLRDPRALEFLRANNRSSRPFVLAAQIRTKNLDASANASGSGETAEGEGAEGGMADEEKPKTINVIYVSDIDLMHSEFLRVRAQPNMGDINWQFDNVTFVLNVVDALANDDRFVDIRKRQTRHSTLKLVEEKTADKRRESDEEIDRFSEDFEQAEQAARANQEKAMQELQQKVTDLQQKAQQGGDEMNSREVQRALAAAVQQVALKESVEQRRLETQVESLTRDRDKKLRTIEREMDTEIQQVQNRYKAMALLLPMLPPLIIGVVVFARRRRLEHEGITVERRK